MSFSITASETRWGKKLFLEASAGTGKTFALEHYIVRSMLTSFFDPSKLALITFTHAVADELKIRLRKTLEEVHTALITSNPIYEYLVPIIEQGPLMARKLEEGIAQLHKASISTIHGFCDRLLIAYGRGERESVSEVEKREYVHDFMRNQHQLSSQEWQLLGRRCGYDSLRLIDEIVNRLEEEIPFYDLSSAFRSISADNFASILSECARGNRGTKNRQGQLKPEFINAFFALEELVRTGPSEDLLRKLFGLNCEQIFSRRKDPQVVSFMEQVWPALRQYILPDGMVERLAAHAGNGFRQYLEKFQKKTPDSIIREVVSLLKEPSFCQMATKAFDWLIIDEFQDTDAYQWQIFSQLFLKNPVWQGSALIVGDPKQAIYAFRQADVYNYLQAKDLFAKNLHPNKLKNWDLDEAKATGFTRSEEDQYCNVGPLPIVESRELSLAPKTNSSACLGIRSLSINYRAEMNMVEALNALFAHFPLFYLPKTDEYLLPVPSDPGLAANPLSDDKGAIHFFVAEGNIGRKRRWPDDALEQSTIFPWIADEMIRLHQKGFAFRDQAILVRDRYQAKRVQTYLKSRKIPTVAWRTDSVLDSPAYTWLQRALFLAVRPTDQRRLSSLLLLCPNEDHKRLLSEMNKVGRVDRFARYVQAWQHVNRAFYRRGIGGFCRYFWVIPYDSTSSVSEFLSSVGWKEDVEHLLELLGLLDLPPALEAYTQALSCLDRYFTDDQLVRRIDPDDIGAPILTMHRSKGLEFEVVYALGCGNRTPKQDPIDESEAEKLRQLYVAVTRAKRRTYLPLILELDGRSIQPGTASPVELFAASFASKESDDSWLERLYTHMSHECMKSVFKDISPSITQQNASVEFLPYSPAEKPISIPFVGTVKGKGQTYLSFSSMQSKKESFTPSGTGGREIGITFHKHIAELLINPKDVLSLIGDQEMAHLIHDALHVELPLGDEKVSLNQIPSSDLRTEISFLDLKDGEYYRGTIDLLVYWKGLYYAIDWKTGVQDPKTYMQEHILKEQARLYKEAILHAFPGKWGGFFFVFVRHIDTGGIVYVF